VDLIRNDLNIKFLNGDKELILTAALNGCIKNIPSYEILNRFKDMDYASVNKRINGTFSHSLGYGHNAALDLIGELVSVKNMTRLAAMAMSAITFGTPHLERSTRRVEVDSFFVPDCIQDDLRRKVEIHLTKLYECYKNFKEKTTLEDAMMTLPLYINTHATYFINGRAVYYIYQMFTGNHKRFDGKIIKTFERPQALKDFGNFIFRIFKEKYPKIFQDWTLAYDSLDFYPGCIEFLLEKNSFIENLVNENISKMNSTALLLSDDENIELDYLEKIIENRSEELAVLRNINYKFLVYIDLAAYQDCLRNRTIDFTIEPLYHAIKRKDFYIPKTILSKNLDSEFLQIVNEEIDFYKTLVENGVPKQEAIGFVPHALKVFSVADTNAFGLIHFITNRSCLRGRPNYVEFANDVRKELEKRNSALTKYLVPRGKLYGLCPDNNIAEGGGKCFYCNNL